jgi:membrane associated rhomboid family serine protease
MYNTGQSQVVFSSPTRLFTPIITAIIVLMIAGFALIHYAAGFTVSNLALAAQSVLRGKIWELVTYSLVNGSPGNLIFNGLVVLFMGSTIEREWGAKSFIVLWLVVAVVCGLIWMAVSLLSGQSFIGIGTEACVYGIVATFGMLYRGTRMWFYFFTVEAQYLALIVIGIGVVMSIVQPLSLIWVSGALVAYLYVKLRWHTASQRGGIPVAGSGRSNGFVDID